LRSALVCSAAALSAIAATACGGSSNGSSASFAAALRAHDGDADNDSLGMGRLDADGDAAPTYGPVAGPAERRAVVALLKRFYTVAAGGDGAKACSLLYRLVAETVVEEHSHARGPRSLRGSTCPQVASKLLQQRHRELTQELGALKVTVVQLRGQNAWVVLDFGPARERLAVLHRDGGGWKLGEFLKEEPL
jgi:hypothetical protein